MMRGSEGRAGEGFAFINILVAMYKVKSALSIVLLATLGSLLSSAFLASLSNPALRILLRAFVKVCDAMQGIAYALSLILRQLHGPLRCDRHPAPSAAHACSWARSRD